jgi:two-component system alkaline phosphatase synthesis response regulator PhoP
MPKLLIVEDDPDIADLMSYTLRKAGHETEHVASGREALARARADPPDAIVLDVMLPGMDGLQVCRTLRSEPQTAAVPIIMVTARGEEADRVSGLDVGADDYLTKPFSPRELVARVHALLRRAAMSGGGAGPALRYGDLVLDSDRHEVTVAGEPIRLTAKEFLLLEYLLHRKGRVVSRDQLLTDVWGYQYTGGTRTVDVHIRRLREKIPLLEQAIETVKQFGYKLAE